MGNLSLASLLLLSLLLVQVVPALTFFPAASVPAFRSRVTEVGNQRSVFTVLASTASGNVVDATAGTDPKPLRIDDAVDRQDSERRLALLNDALCSFNSSSSAALLAELGALRSSNTTSGITSQQAIEAFLNDLVSRCDELPAWSKLLRGPLARFSKRARLSALRRTLDLATPPPSVEEEEDTKKDAGDDEIEKQRRRRRAFLSILRSLSVVPDDGGTTLNVAGPAIRYLEKKARRENRMMQRMRSSNDEDLTQRRPADLETPKYTVVAKANNGVEIRRYEPFSVCSVSMTKPRPTDSYKTDATINDPKTGGARGFGALAGYLFGKNQKEKAMKMTTPVLSNEAADGDKTMSFVLPSDYWNDVSTAPQPLAGSGVTLRRLDGDERAVVMFGGYTSKSTVELRKQQLVDGLSKDDKWEAIPDDVIVLSQYNDPFTPPWRRLNEVSIRVRPVDIE